MPVSNDYPQAAGILALDTAVHAVMGGAAATAISLNPIVGMTFGAVYFAGSTGVNFLEQWMDSKGYGPFNNSTTFAKVIKFAIAFLSGIALATAGCTFFGAPIVFSAGLSLTAAMFATTATIATFVHNHHHAHEVIIGPNLLTALRC